jgi:hypothetical protein
MPDAASFVSEFHAKNQASLERLVVAFRAAVTKETLEIADLVRLAMKVAIESAEVSALWLVDCDDLEMKVGLSEQCGDAARHYRLLSRRLEGLGSEPFDPRQGGYSKVFAFLRALQTPEERASAGQVTLRTFTLGRLEAMAQICEERGDAETASLFRDQLGADERRGFDAGWKKLIASTPQEESQARARRAAFRVVELAAEAVEPLQLRKSLPRRRS